MDWAKAIAWQDELEQLERLRSEDTPRRPMITHTIDQFMLNPLKPDVKARMKMKLEQRRQAMLQLHLNYRQFYCQLRCVLY